MADNKKPSGLKFSPWWISGAIIFMFVLLNIISISVTVNMILILCNSHNQKDPELIDNY